jgi:glutaredoxin 2
MDITASLAKQNKEVDKITNDIRDLQKTINLNTNTLQRADAISEELIFKVFHLFFICFLVNIPSFFFVPYLFYRLRMIEMILLWLIRIVV